MTNTSPRYLSCAETAKLLRQALKARFPGVKFSVHSDTYSGGASIRVGWTDGPRNAEVRDVTERFCGADFDGMIDLKSYRGHYLYPDGSIQLARIEGTTNSGGLIEPLKVNASSRDQAELVHLGADFIFTNRAVTDYIARSTAAAAYVRAHCRMDEYDRSGNYTASELGSAMARDAVYLSANAGWEPLERTFRRVVLREPEPVVCKTCDRADVDPDVIMTRCEHMTCATCGRCIGCAQRSKGV